jgi:hypothetical protein
MDSTEKDTINTHDHFEAGTPAGGDVGPTFLHDTNATAMSDRLRQLWQAGTHDITITFSDGAPLRPPPPGHTDR